MSGSLTIGFSCPSIPLTSALFLSPCMFDTLCAIMPFETLPIGSK